MQLEFLYVSFDLVSLATLARIPLHLPFSKKHDTLLVPARLATAVHQRRHVAFRVMSAFDGTLGCGTSFSVSCSSDGS